MEPLENTISPWRGLLIRVASAIALGAFFLGALWIGGWVFDWFVLLAALLMMREWNVLTENEGPLWRAIGLLYVTIPCASLIWLRALTFSQPNDGLKLVLYVMFAVWATDIGAFFAGRIIGGAKMAPAISPGKTWAGLGGGILAAMLSGLFSSFTPYPTNWASCAGLGLILALLSQGGDLFESWLKRRAGVKDSGTLIPGHGGLLDRIDGLIFTIPLFALLVYFS